MPYIGSVKLVHELPEDAVASRARVKYENGRWYLSVGLRIAEKPAENKTHVAGGLDVGISPLVVEQDSTVHENPKPYRRMLRRLRRWQRAQSRREVGSRGWYEAQRRVDTINRRIKGLRSNAHHQVSRSVVMKYAVLGIETLNVRGMDRLRWQARAIRDAAIGGLLVQVKYKADLYGTTLVEAPLFYPSSKMCSSCGEVNADLGRESHWVCTCGAEHDRKLSAASNLHKLTLGAVGPDVTRRDLKALARREAGETVGDERRSGPLQLSRAPA